MKLITKRLGKYWWIIGDEADGPYGPYDTRNEAEEDRKGLLRTLDNMNKHSFFTGDRDDGKQ